jgi:hypothetical protein
MSVPQKGHFRLSALSHLTVSLICLPHLEHVISSGKLSKNMVLFRRYTKLFELAKLGLIIALIRVLEKMIGRAIREWRDFGSLEKRIVPTSKI